jgi:hypothetical protein
MSSMHWGRERRRYNQHACNLDDKIFTDNNFANGKFAHGNIDNRLEYIFQREDFWAGFQL